ncbi:tetratricopeptide repeat protein [Erythrobacter arachoides]|uniref:Tetratricopeptide repeat protein n=1 Tax=Aurantiacibacter arachoides TaxID=1850444 RepID=A0A844ZZJ5_9SPHN|nr:tetratricopeptide repeat protein [Aurantiacibacter arachoides]MXO93138.1 tetratricopeptide repeat protein [Aurantiacibacter arachoides]GGD51760.1 hypothetical protein GCM10011411_09470 [Aurantiacibacter arachoides]
MTLRSLLFLVSFLALGACSVIAPGPLENARGALARQDYPAARDLVQTALAKDASNPEALELLARIQLLTGAGAEALTTLSRLDALGAAAPEDGLLRAEALLQTGEIARARSILSGKTSAESWRLRAQAAILEGDEAMVRDAFARGRRAQGDQRKLFTLEATWHLDRGDVQGARYAVGQVQQLAPDAVETLFVSARFANLLDEHTLALRAYMAILAIVPTDRPALLGAIASARNIGRADLAAPLVARGAAAYPGDVAFIYHTALLDADAGRWQAVRERLQQSEREVGEFAPARLLYGQAMLELGQIELARAMILPLYRAAPDNLGYRRTYARILLASGDLAEAGRVIAPVLNGRYAIQLDREIAERAARG